MSLSVLRGAAPAALALAACVQVPAAAERETLHAKVLAIDPRTSIVRIHHDPYPAMPMAMTMNAQLRPADLRTLHVGDRVVMRCEIKVDPWACTGVRRVKR